MQRLVLILLLCLSGCQSLPENQLIYQRDGGRYALHTQWKGPAQQLLQQVTFTGAGQQQEFLLSVQLDTQQMLLVGLSPLGHELWRITLTPDGELVSTGIQPFADRRFALQLVAQMQWSLLPLQDVQAHLSALTMKELPQQRQLIDASGAIVLTIDGPGELAVGKTIRVRDSNFELNIVTLERDQL